jgi:hypothetical protein
VSAGDTTTVKQFAEGVGVGGHGGGRNGHTITNVGSINLVVEDDPDSKPTQCNAISDPRCLIDTLNDAVKQIGGIGHRNRSIVV